MTLNDVEEDLPYTMGRLIAGARNKKNISLEELSQGVMSAEDLNFIEKDDEYADKTTWDFLLGRLGISPLIYECYVEQEEYDLFKARKEMREISNQIMSNGLMSNERLRSKNTAQLKLLADQLEKRSQKFDGLLPLYFLRYSAMQHIFDCEHERICNTGKTARTIVQS